MKKTIIFGLIIILGIIMIGIFSVNGLQLSSCGDGESFVDEQGEGYCMLEDSLIYQVGNNNQICTSDKEALR